MFNSTIQLNQIGIM